MEHNLNRTGGGNDDAHSALNEGSNRLQGQICASPDISSRDTFSRTSHTALSSDNIGLYLPHGTTIHDYPESHGVEDTEGGESFIVDHTQDGSVTVERVMAVLFR
jgi:hypothetical protein